MLTVTPEFHCLDCGAHVVAYGFGEVPKPARCMTCVWISENVLPEDEAAVRDRLGVPLLVRQ